ncbi:MAG TPA: cell wall-binding repeat-containing protein, partial [Solirubrobacteraceae bacterium]|nr:cell wall-binding repeat-containing protein [Solirubrobacteraceae bacterium]
MSSLPRKRPGALRLASVLALGACLLAACGKSAGPGKSLSPVAEQGAVSVVTGNTSRIGGSDAASDAAAVARSIYPGLTPSSRPEAIVLVDEGSYQTALAASSLASIPLNAPLLFSSGGSLPGVSSEAIENLHPHGDASLGGAQVIRVGSSASVPGKLRTLTLPARAPAAAAAAIAQLLARARGSEPHQAIVVPTGAPRSQLMPVAGLSAQSGAPILFATSAGVPSATAAALQR